MVLSDFCKMVLALKAQSQKLEQRIVSNFFKQFFKNLPKKNLFQDSFSPGEDGFACSIIIALKQ